MVERERGGEEMARGRRGAVEEERAQQGPPPPPPQTTTGRPTRISTTTTSSCKKEGEESSLPGVEATFRRFDASRDRSRNFSFTSMEQVLRETLAPEVLPTGTKSTAVHEVPSPTVAETWSHTMNKKRPEEYLGSRPPLTWAEGARDRTIREAEESYAARNLDLPSSRLDKSVIQRTQKSFRWVVRLSETGLWFVALDGDPGAIYPGLTREHVARDSNCFAKYFSKKTFEEMAFLGAQALQGADLNGLVMTYHSVPTYAFIAQVEIYTSVSYLDADGKLACVQTGETREVTGSMNEYASLIAKITAEHRETVDHRFGNKVRLMHLLCQENRVDELNDCFERLRYEVDIRRKLFHNLPPITPVTPADFVKPEFLNVDVALEVENNADPDKAGLLFYNFQRDPVNPIVLQVLVLQDCASNAFKHGTGSVKVRVQSDALIFSNPVRKLAGSGGEPSRHIGLGALRSVCAQLGLEMDIHETRDLFVLTLSVFVDILHDHHQGPSSLAGRGGLSSSSCDDNNTSAAVQSSLCTSGATASARDAAPPQRRAAVSPTLPPGPSRVSIHSPLAAEKKPPLARAAPTVAAKNGEQPLGAASFRWVLIDDEELICYKFAKLIEKKFKVNVLTVQTPADVANVDKILYGIASKQSDPRPVVAIFDETLLELDDALDTVCVTGTQLRDRLFASPRIKALIDARKLLLFSSSASAVHDDRVILKLGKSGAVAADVQRVVAAVANLDQPKRLSNRDASPDSVASVSTPVPV